MTHPARTIPFDELFARLQAAKAERLVTEAVGADGLRLYCYSNSCVYDRRWDEITLLSRGLIVDPAARRVVATPFPKFFNVGERLDSIPDLPFEVYEKLDGSLIILFHHAGQWRCATKGSLDSSQARWAASWIAGRDLSALDTGTTYLAEALYPENRIVVHYPDTGLVLLGAYNVAGEDLMYAELQDVGTRLGWRVARRHVFPAMSELLAHARGLPPTEEGFVLRFSNGLRLKVKGEEYCRIHRAISRVTPLALWEAMAAADDLAALRRQIPEEFWGDFDAIISTIQASVDALVADVRAAAEPVAGLTDKEVGLRLSQFPERVRRFIFPHRSSGGNLLEGRMREVVFRVVRPTNNVLPGYVPSYAMHRVMDDDA